MFFESVGREVEYNSNSLHMTIYFYLRYLRNVYTAITSNDMFLKPNEALEIANDFKRVMQFKNRLDNGNVKYLSTEEIGNLLYYINHIKTKYGELLEYEENNGGNLHIANSIVFDDDKTEPVEFNYNNTISTKFLAEL